MPYTDDLKLPTASPAISTLTLDSQKRGVITLIDKSNLPKDALEEAINLFLYENGNAGPRPGVNWYGTALPNGAEIDGFDYFDNSGTIHIVAVGGGNVYRSTDNAQNWTLCSGGTMTSGLNTEFNQAGGYLYITDGAANTLRYNGTTTLQAYTGILAPGVPTATGSASLISGSTPYTYYYKVAAVNAVGFTQATAAGSVAVNKDYTQWDSTTNFVTLTHTASAGALRHDYFRSENNIDFYYIGSGVGASTTFVDTGYTAITATLAPTTNTTTGDKYAELTSVGSRQIGVRHATNRYQIGYSSGEEGYEGAFSYGGGSVSWQKGGKYIPVKAEDYRDGKGTSVTTIWCDSADGQGCVIQMTLDQVTIAEQTFYLPSLYKLPGSRGTPAPGSVVNVLNDYYFYNSQAIYNLGNRANLQQLLSTDEMSANIRPTVKQTSTGAESKIASCYFDAKIFLSVPRGATDNNRTMIYDTERRAWLPDAFTLGFKKFLRYTSLETDGSKTQRLLCVKPGDNRLSEIAYTIQGDYGEAFETSLKTGLYPVTKDRFGFQSTQEAEIELSNPQGTINIELLGNERKRGYATQKTQTIQSTLTNTGHSTFLHSTRYHSDTADATDTFSESSVKRYFKVKKELNAVQWHVTTNSQSAFYLMRTLQTWGRATRAGKPREWQLK